MNIVEQFDLLQSTGQAEPPRDVVPLDSIAGAVGPTPSFAEDLYFTATSLADILLPIYETKNDVDNHDACWVLCKCPLLVDDANLFLTASSARCEGVNVG